MSKQNKGGQASGADAPAIEQPAVTPLQNRLSNYSQFQKLVENYKLYQAHLERLTIHEIEDEFQENVGKNEACPVRITLEFGDSRADEYVIKNPALLTDVREFMVNRITLRMAETEKEIIACQV